MIEARQAQEQVDLFLSATTDARSLSEKCRDYYDHKQWTDAEVAKLQKRKQAPIVVNRVRPKIKGLVGLYNLRQTDPKAYPRTQKHEKAAHAVTDALRYVADNNDFNNKKLDVADEFFVEGYGGCAVPVKKRPNGEIEVEVNVLPWDRIYFDPHSRARDFSDARFKGYYLWMSFEEAEELFPDADISQFQTAPGTDETNEDRPRWIDSQHKRMRVAVHYFRHKGKWHFGILTEGAWLEEPQESPYMDEDGEPACIIELVCANIDRDNNRYGEAAGFLSQQDEINHRRSKFLHLLNQRQTYGRKGSKADVTKLKRELSKPDGHVEFNGEEWGKDFGIIPTNDMARGQFELYQDGKMELDSVSYNAQLSGERSQGDLSGRAIEKLQAAGTVELNQDYNQLAGWEKRVYRQIWARVKQFWTEEKWIRVTDDEASLRWVGFNTQITARQFLEEKINDESLPLVERKKYAASYTYLKQMEASNDLAAAEQATQALEALVATDNQIAEIDVDIIIDQSFEAINVQEEQFRLLAQFASGSDIDVIELIELSQLRGKEKLIEKIEQRRAQAAEAAGGLADVQSKNEQMKGIKMAAEADMTQAKADQTKIENQLLIAQPIPVTSVAV